MGGRGLDPRVEDSSRLAGLDMLDVPWDDDGLDELNGDEP